MQKLSFIAGLLLIAGLLFCFQQTDRWRGKWSGEHPEGVTYTIQVNDKVQGRNRCLVHAEGIQTFYSLNCRATSTPTTLKVYFQSVKEGAFYAQDRVDPNQPLFTLTREKGKVNWQWQQIFDGKLVVHKR